jgi:hypothetical protein
MFRGTQERVKPSIAARDRALLPLQAELATIRRASDPFQGLLDALLRTERMIDRFFFSDALADFIVQKQENEVKPLLRHVARRIQATYRIKHKERLNLTRRIFEKVIRVG